VDIKSFNHEPIRWLKIGGNMDSTIELMGYVITILPDGRLFGYNDAKRRVFIAMSMEEAEVKAAL
jgi:hypothetical protein